MGAFTLGLDPVVNRVDRYLAGCQRRFDKAVREIKAATKDIADAAKIVVPDHDNENFDPDHADQFDCDDEIDSPSMADIPLSPPGQFLGHPADTSVPPAPLPFTKVNFTSAVEAIDAPPCTPKNESKYSLDRLLPRPAVCLSVPIKSLPRTMNRRQRRTLAKLKRQAAV